MKPRLKDKISDYIAIGLTVVFYVAVLVAGWYLWGLFIRYHCGAG